MNRKPNGFKEWRKLFHETASDLGHVVHGYHKANTHEWRSSNRRFQYELICRMSRIENQMHAEFEAGTASAMDAVLDMVFKRKTKE